MNLNDITEEKIISKIGLPAYLATLGAIFFFVAQMVSMIMLYGGIYLYSDWLGIAFNHASAKSIAEFFSVPLALIAVFRSFYEKQTKEE